MKRPTTRRLVFTSVATLATYAAGCCGGDGVNANVSGLWTITGEGKWTECGGGEDAGTGSIDFDSVIIDVGQSAASGENPDPVWLATAVNVADGTFEFGGKVDGGCVDFHIDETGPDYELRLEFEGAISGEEIDGAFHGSGGGFCNIEGDFVVDVQPRSAGPIGGDDGGPPDDGGGDSNSGDSVGGDSMAGDALSGDPSVGDPGAPGDPRRRTGESCATREHCDQGDCVDARCVIECSVSTDCVIGEACDNSACIDAEQSCRCASSGSALYVLATGAVFLFRLRRRRG